MLEYLLIELFLVLMLQTVPMKLRHFVDTIKINEKENFKQMKQFHHCETEVLLNQKGNFDRL